MVLLSNRQEFDSIAGKRAQAAIDSFNAMVQGKTWTLLEAVSAADLDYPMSEKDLSKTFKVLDFWQINHNLINEPIWLRLIND
jgi:hypothetical protein